MIKYMCFIMIFHYFRLIKNSKVQIVFSNRIAKKSFYNSLYMAKPKVLVTRPDVPKEGIDMLKEKCDVEIYNEEKPIPQKDLLKMVAGKDALFCLLTDNIDKEVISAAGKQLKIIATMSVGFEHIDLNACKANDIQVSHTPNVSTDSVAEWTIALMLTASRRLIEAATAIANGKWVYSWGPVWLCGDGIKDTVVGIVGMGRIGQGILARVLPFGPKKVLYYDVFHPIKPAEDMGAEYSEFENLLKTSDFIVSITNLTEETRNIFCKKTFEMMKPSAVFVNTGRGGLVNQDDLYEALKNNTIRAAALDVTVPEPLPKDHKLLSLSNLTITPHVASAELHVRKLMAKMAAENILNVLSGKKPVSPVELPK